MIMTSKNLDEKFSTHDFSLAATISLFHPIEDIDRENPRRAEFVFKRDAELDDLISSYWRRELKVDPQSHADAMRILKARLYER